MRRELRMRLAREIADGHRRTRNDAMQQRLQRPVGGTDLELIARDLTRDECRNRHALQRLHRRQVLYTFHGGGS